MAKLVEGKVALITGAAGGIGREHALMLASHGAKIVVNDLGGDMSGQGEDLTQAQKVVEEIQAMGGEAVVNGGNVASFTDAKAMIDQAIDTYGDLNILINNAATTNFLRFDDLDALTEDHWDRVLQTNVKAPFYMVRAARRWLEASTEGGEIIHITSIAGMTGNGSSLAYCASKAALINMTLSMARILAPKIRVNAVAPGFIADQWTQQGLGERYGAAVQTHTQKALLGKVSEPEDVAMAVLSLITGSDMITGQNLVCDGGSMIGPRA